MSYVKTHFLQESSNYHCYALDKSEEIEELPGRSASNTAQRAFLESERSESVIALFCDATDRYLQVAHYHIDKRWVLEQLQRHESREEVAEGNERRELSVSRARSRLLVRRTCVRRVRQSTASWNGERGTAKNKSSTHGVSREP